MFKDFLRIVFCWLWINLPWSLSCLLLSHGLWINFVCIGYWISFIVILISLGLLDLNFKGFHHLLGGDCGTTIVIQHLHHRNWVLENTSIGQPPSIALSYDHDEFKAQSPCYHQSTMVRCRQFLFHMIYVFCCISLLILLVVSKFVSAGSVKVCSALGPSLCFVILWYGLVSWYMYCM